MAMASEQNGDSSDTHAEPDFAKAFQELARGERAAAALENHLDSLEKKIEELLAKADEDEKNLKARPETSAETPSSSDTGKSAS
ncbi:hypothetical protein CC80DRAFT_133080 [Byssothecium circinans]|uniref:Uncharacterized protein n=1 Tax=Byssothecium circinans TaxID=147558 RepID=A0A6A5TPL8_9PLEO|nr:hypothetical protein CC80DRAFT_133080 [Byssothecium circinans]